MTIWAVPSTVPVLSCPALTHGCGLHSHAVRSSAKLLQLWNLLPGDKSAPSFFFSPSMGFLGGNSHFFDNHCFSSLVVRVRDTKFCIPTRPVSLACNRQLLLLSLTFLPTIPGVYSHPRESRAAAMGWMDSGLTDKYVGVPVWLPPTGFWSWLQTQSLSGLCLGQEESEGPK